MSGRSPAQPRRSSPDVYRQEEVGGTGSPQGRSSDLGIQVRGSPPYDRPGRLAKLNSGSWTGSPSLESPLSWSRKGTSGEEDVVRKARTKHVRFPSGNKGKLRPVFDLSRSPPRESRQRSPLARPGPTYSVGETAARSLTVKRTAMGSKEKPCSRGWKSKATTSREPTGF